MILSALSRQRCTYIESMEGSVVPVILSAVLMTLCRAFLSACVVLPYQTVIPAVRMLSISPLKAWVRGRRFRLAFLSSLMK